MLESTPQEGSSGKDDSHVTLLSEQITLLRELIIVMVAQGRDTRHQSEKLFVMLREFRDAKLTCALRVRSLEPQVDEAERSITPSADGRNELNA